MYSLACQKGNSANLCLEDLLDSVPGMSKVLESQEIAARNEHLVQPMT